MDKYHKYVLSEVGCDDLEPATLSKSFSSERSNALSKIMDIYILSQYYTFTKKNNPLLTNRDILSVQVLDELEKYIFDDNDVNYIVEHIDKVGYHNNWDDGINMYYGLPPSYYKFIIYEPDTPMLPGGVALKKLAAQELKNIVDKYVDEIDTKNPLEDNEKLILYHLYNYIYMTVKYGGQFHINIDKAYVDKYKTQHQINNSITLYDLKETLDNISRIITNYIDDLNATPKPFVLKFFEIIKLHLEREINAAIEKQKRLRESTTPAALQQASSAAKPVSPASSALPVSPVTAASAASSAAAASAAASSAAASAASAAALAASSAASTTSSKSSPSADVEDTNTLAKNYKEAILTHMNIKDIDVKKLQHYFNTAENAPRIIKSFYLLSMYYNNTSDKNLLLSNQLTPPDTVKALINNYMGDYKNYSFNEFNDGKSKELLVFIHALPPTYYIFIHNPWYDAIFNIAQQMFQIISADNTFKPDGTKEKSWLVYRIYKYIQMTSKYGGQQLNEDTKKNLFDKIANIKNGTRIRYSENPEFNREQIKQTFADLKNFLYRDEFQQDIYKKFMEIIFTHLEKEMMQVHVQLAQQASVSKYVATYAADTAKQHANAYIKLQTSDTNELKKIINGLAATHPVKYLFDLDVFSTLSYANIQQFFNTESVPRVLATMCILKYLAESDDKIKSLYDKIKYTKAIFNDEIIKKFNEVKLDTDQDIKQYIDAVRIHTHKLFNNIKHLAAITENEYKNKMNIYSYIYSPIYYSQVYKNIYNIDIIIDKVLNVRMESPAGIRWVQKKLLEYINIETNGKYDSQARKQALEALAEALKNVNPGYSDNKFNSMDKTLFESYKNAISINAKGVLDLYFTYIWKMMHDAQPTAAPAPPASPSSSPSKSPAKLPASLAAPPASPLAPAASPHTSPAQASLSPSPASASPSSSPSPSQVVATAKMTASPAQLPAAPAQLPAAPSPSKSSTMQPSINYDKVLNAILDVKEDTDDATLTKQINTFVSEMFKGNISAAILPKSLTIYFIIVIDHILENSKEQYKDKARTKIKKFKDALSGINFQNLPIGDAFDEEEIDEVIESILKNKNNDNFERFITDNKQNIMNMFNLMPYSYFNMFIKLYKFYENNHNYHILFSYKTIITNFKYDRNNHIIHWLINKIIKTIDTIDFFANSIWDTYDYTLSIYEDITNRTQNDITTIMNTIKDLEQHINTQNDLFGPVFKDMLVKILNYIKIQIFGEIYGYWQKQGRPLNSGVFYVAADDNIRKMYNLVQRTSSKSRTADPATQTTREIYENTTTLWDRPNIAKQSRGLNEQFGILNEELDQLTKNGNQTHNDEQRKRMRTLVEQMEDINEQIKKIGPFVESIARKQYDDQHAPAPAPAALAPAPAAPAAPVAASVLPSWQHLGPPKRQPLYLFPQPPQKEDYHNLKYAKFKPLPEFAKYHSSYIGLATLEAVPILKRIFNTDEQTIWKYMQKRSILFSKTNKEKNFAQKLLFVVLAEQITKNIRNDFDVQNIGLQNMVEYELRKILKNDYTVMKYITKLDYKNIYNSIVLELFK